MVFALFFLYSRNSRLSGVQRKKTKASENSTQDNMEFSKDTDKFIFDIWFVTKKNNSGV